MRISDCSSDVCSSDLPWRIGLWSDRRWRRDHHRELPGATGASSGTRRTAADASGAARRNDACFAGDDQTDRVRPGDHPPLLRTASDVHGCRGQRSEEHTSELQSLMRISYAVFCLKKKKKQTRKLNITNTQEK